MRNFTLFLVLFLLAKTCNGQTFSKAWERRLGGVDSDEIQTAIEDKRGRIIAVGQTKSKMFKGEDILIRILDKNGDILLKDNIGGSGDEGAFSIIESFDGGFVLAGYTSSKWADVDTLFECSSGRTDAWIVKTDEEGYPLWHRIFGSKKEDQFRDILQLTDGSIIAAGQQNKAGMIVKISEDGTKGIWKRELSENESIIESICLDNDSNILLAGTMGRNNKKAFVLKMDQEGDFLSPPKIIHKNLINGKKIIFNFQTNQYILAGDIKSRYKRKDMGLFLLNKEMEVVDHYPYGGSDDDLVKDLIQTNEGAYIMVGQTYSHINGANRSRGMIVFPDKNGQALENSIQVLGGTQQDYFSAISELSDGNYLLSGASASPSDSSSVFNLSRDMDAWIVKISRKETKNNNINADDINVSEGDWNRGEGKYELAYDQRAYLDLLLENKGEKTASGLKIYITPDRQVEGLYLMDTLLVKPILSKSIRKVSIPVNSDLDLAEDSLNIALELVSPAEKLIKRIDFGLKTKSIPSPNLKITNIHFSPDSVLLRRKDTISLEIKIENTGNKIAEMTAVRIFLPDRVEYIKNNLVDVGSLHPGESQSVNFSFKAKSYYAPDTIPIRILAIESTARSGASSSTGIRIINFYYDVKENFEFIKRPTNNYFRDTKGRGGPSAEIDFIIPSIRRFLWLAPEREVEGSDIDVRTDSLPIRLRVESEIELTSDDYQLFVNDKKAVAGKNIVEKATSYTSSIDHFEDIYVYFYYTEVLLKEGENKIVLKVKTKTGWMESPPMYLRYKLPEFNLHVYAFGVPFNDLNYTTKDAKDFAESFRQQSGKLFKEVFIHTFTKSEETTVGHLRKAIESIFNEFNREDNIKEGDVIMIFISSHGFIRAQKPKDFRIAASDFDKMNTWSTSIEFQDLLEMLGQIHDTHKIIFIDACFSGAIANLDKGTKGNDDLGNPPIAKAIIDLATAATGFNIIASCSAGELSYEDEKWENGAFTKAILEAFKNAEVNGTRKKISVEQDGNGILYLQELYDFLKERVPAIVKTKRPRLPKEVQQTPYMCKGQGIEDIPIFIH